MRATLIFMTTTLAFVARADQSIPDRGGAPSCQRPTAEVVAEVQRLLASAAAHASHSDVCTDGDGERIRIVLTRACAVDGTRVRADYDVITTFEVGGECSPYLACAQPPPPETTHASTTVTFGSRHPGGRVLITPARLEGLTLRTPLRLPHSGGCGISAPPFEPQVLRGQRLQ